MVAFLFMGSIFFAVGALVVYFGFRERRIMNELRASGQEAQATVMAVDRKVTRDSDGDTDTDWVVTYQFSSLDGQTHVGTKRYETPRNLPNVGNTIMVMYMPDKPERNRVAQDVQSSFGPIMIIGIGLVFALFGVGMLYVAIAGLVS